MNDLALMQEIRARWQTTISGAISGTAIPEAFVAALVANESGGDPSAKRYEKNVHYHLWEVLMGRRDKFSSISKAELLKYLLCVDPLPVSVPQSLPIDALQRLD